MPAPSKSAKQVLSLEVLVRRRRNSREWSPSRSRDVTRRVLRLALDRSSANAGSWHEDLGEAVQDRYVRRRPTAARSWPYKKRVERTRPPQMRLLTRRQRTLGKRLLDGS